jgi:hypothetical protein
LLPGKFSKWKRPANPVPAIPIRILLFIDSYILSYRAKLTLPAGTRGAAFRLPRRDSDLLRCPAFFRFPWNGNEPTGCVAASS